MKPKQIIKIFVDVVMTGLFIVLMAYHITGNTVHEWLGISLFVLFILHHILNIGWYKTVFRGRYSPMRIFMLVLNCLLFIAMLGMMVSGIMLSREVFGFLHLRAGMFGRRLHMVSTAWGYLLMSMHLGMHWGMVVGMVHRRFSPKGKWPGIIAKIIAFLLAAYGVYALITRQLVERMFLLMEYAFFDYGEPAAHFFGDYLCILILFAAVSYYACGLLKKAKPKRSK